MNFDIAQELVAARGRLASDSDREVFDRALEAAQTEPDAVRAMLECALSMVGLEQADLAYQQHLYPFDTAQQAAQMAKSQSGCGLTTEEIWRAGGASDPFLRMPYAKRVASGGIHYAVALEKHIALESNAWRDLRQSAELPILLPADALIIGCKGCPGTWALQTFTDEHEFTAVLVETLPATDTSPEGEVLVHSVDGGQGNPAIALRTRKLVLAGREVWLASLDAAIRPDGRPAKGRRAQGYSRATSIPGISSSA